MIAFTVPANSPIYAVKSGLPWTDDTLQPAKTRHENLFVLEDMVIDPTGILDLPEPQGEMAGVFMNGHYYGFESNGWVMLVACDYVSIPGEDD